MNDIVDYETRYFSTAMYADDLKAEFRCALCRGRTRRRMMSVSAHDRIAGRPSRAKVLERFITLTRNPILASHSCVKMRLRALLGESPDRARRHLT